MKQCTKKFSVLFYRIKDFYYSNIWSCLSKKHQEWLWFVILWCGGLGSAMLLGYVIRTAMHIK